MHFKDPGDHNNGCINSTALTDHPQLKIKRRILALRFLIN